MGGGGGLFFSPFQADRIAGVLFAMNRSGDENSGKILSSRSQTSQPSTACRKRRRPT